MLRFDLLHDSSPHLRIGLVLPDIVYHLPDGGNHHIRTVDHYMMPAAASDDATALRRQRFQALLQLVPDGLRRDVPSVPLSVPCRIPPLGIPRDDYERDVVAATRLRRFISGMPELVPLGKSGAGIGRGDTLLPEPHRATHRAPFQPLPCTPR